MDDAVGQLGGNGPAISHLVSGEDGVGFGVKIFLPLRSPAPGAGDRKGRPDTVSLTLPVFLICLTPTIHKASGQAKKLIAVINSFKIIVSSSGLLSIGKCPLCIVF